MWRLRYLLVIVLAHLAVLLVGHFLFLLGDTLLAGYATLVRDPLLAGEAAQMSWLQRMGSDTRGALAYVVSLSAALQMVLFAWRARAGPTTRPRASVRQELEDFSFGLARALRAVGIGLVSVAWVSVLASATRQSPDVRTDLVVAAAIVGVGVSQWFTALPPSSSAGRLPNKG